MKTKLFALALLTFVSCQVPSNHQHFNPIVTGVVTKIGLTSGTYQEFIVTLRDTNGTLHEKRTEEISYSVGDTVTLELNSK
jgi:hypothetical protein